MIDISPYIDKLFLLGLWVENKIYCYGDGSYPYSFDYFIGNVIIGTQHDGKIPLTQSQKELVGLPYYTQFNQKNK